MHPSGSLASLGEEEQLQSLHKELATLRSRGESSKRPSEGRRQAHAKGKLIVCALRRPVKVTTDASGGVTLEESSGGFKRAIDGLESECEVHWVTWPGEIYGAAAQDTLRDKLQAENNTTAVFLTRELVDLYYRQLCGQELWMLYHSRPRKIGLKRQTRLYEAFVAANRLFLEAVSRCYVPGDIVLVYDFPLLLLPSLVRRRFANARVGLFMDTRFPSPDIYCTSPLRSQLLHGMLGADTITFHDSKYSRNFGGACTRVLGLTTSPKSVVHEGRTVNLSVNPLGITPELFALTPALRTRIAALRHRFEGMRIIIGMDRLNPCRGLPHKLLAFESMLTKYPQWRGKVVFVLVVREPWGGDWSQFEALRAEVDTLIGRIHGTFATADYSPIRYLHKSLPAHEVVALYAVSDVALFTSTCEGLDLAALEYVACQQPKSEGVLMYSEFAGCAQALRATRGAVIVNPFDTEGVAHELQRALSLRPTRRAILHHYLARYMHQYSATMWSHRMLRQLRHAAPAIMASPAPVALSQLSRATTRLLLFEYEGVLVPHRSVARLSEPPVALRRRLAALARDENTVVVLLTSVPRKVLEGPSWFGLSSESSTDADVAADGSPAFPGERRIGVVAELGVAARLVRCRDSRSARPESGSLPARFGELARGGAASRGARWREWLNLRISNGHATNAVGLDAEPPLSARDSDGASAAAPRGRAPGERGGAWDGAPSGDAAADASALRIDLDHRWMDATMQVLEYFTERTPGSWIDVGKSTVRWHWSDSDETFGSSQVQSAAQILQGILPTNIVQIVLERQFRFLLVRPTVLTKKRTLARVVEATKPASGDFDVVVYVGQDENLTALVNRLPGAMTFQVQRKQLSHAQFFVETTDEVGTLLDRIAEAIH